MSNTDTLSKEVLTEELAPIFGTAAEGAEGKALMSDIADIVLDVAEEFSTPKP